MQETSATPISTSTPSTPTSTSWEKLDKPTFFGVLILLTLAIDMLFIFGLLGGGATTLGLAAPLINDGLSVLFGFPSSTFSQIMVLLVCTSIFAYSAYAGLEKGIQMLSNINLWGALILLGFVLVAGPTVFLLETNFDALGRMLSNFFVMATWAEPFGGLPLLVICVLLIMSIVRVAYLDLFFQEDYENSIINISSFPDYDPWSNEGIALAKF